MTQTLKRNDLVYPELSYEIVGCAFELIKEIGAGHKESVYQNGLKLVLEKKKISFKEQVFYPVKFEGKTIGKNFFDFLVDEKVVVEIKRNLHFSKAHIDQVLNYLKVSDLKLAILINFGSEGVTFKRIVNVNNTPVS